MLTLSKGEARHSTSINVSGSITSRSSTSLWCSQVMPRYSHHSPGRALALVGRPTGHDTATIDLESKFNLGPPAVGLDRDFRADEEAIDETSRRTATIASLSSSATLGASPTHAALKLSTRDSMINVGVNYHSPNWRDYRQSRGAQSIGPLGADRARQIRGSNKSRSRRDGVLQHIDSQIAVNRGIEDLGLKQQRPRGRKQAVKARRKETRDQDHSRFCSNFFFPAMTRPLSKHFSHKTTGWTCRSGNTRVSLAALGLILGEMPFLGAIINGDAGASVVSDNSRSPAIIHQPASVTWRAISWKMCFSGTITQSSPAVTSYRGQTVVAVGDETGVVHLIDATTGRSMPGWPQAMATSPGKVAPIESSPTFAYFNGSDAPPDIIVSAGSTWVKSTEGEVEAFSITGRQLWVFHVGRAVDTADGVISTPAVGDVIGNHRLEVVFGSWDHNIYVLNARGGEMGFAYDNADTIWSSPALYRLPGRRAADIYIGSDASGRTDSTLRGGRCVGGYLTDFRWSPRAVNPDTRAIGPGLTRSWYKCLNQSIWSSPAVGVINATGRAAVVVGSGFFEQPFPSDTNRLFAFYAKTGAPVPGWPVRTAGPAIGSPAIGTIGTSNTPAIVETVWICAGKTQSDCVVTNHSRIEAFSGAGRAIWHTELLGPAIEGSATLVPLRGETGNDVLVGTSYGIYPLDGTNGRYLFGTNGSDQWAAVSPACRVFSTIAVAPVASGWEAIASCGGPPQFHFPGEVAAFPLLINPTSTPAWPMFHYNDAHDGSSSP